jgi:acyl-CoA reductase-like NAD-dependent aldehyde dehydrogenase
MKAAPAGHAITCESAQRTHDLIDEAVAEGATIIIGENKMVGRSSLQPSILSNINSKSRINKEEIWGPAASFSTFSTDKEAVEIANSTEFGLSASIFTKDYARALKMARDLDFGQVQVNALTLNTTSTTPVTGYKGSGWGSNGGGYGVEEFMFNKHVLLCP